MIGTGRVYRPALLAALAGGTVLWLVTMAATGSREAWDSPHYWSITYPICIAYGALLGFLDPERPWRWGLALMMVQFLVMMFTSGNSWNLLPIGIAYMLIVSLPVMAAAVLCGWLRRWRDA